MPGIAEQNHAFKTEYMTPFVNSIRGLFEGSLGKKVTFGKLKINEDGTPPHEISGVISFTGTVMGRAVVSFPLDVSVSICKDYLQMDELPEGVVPDCMGEIANVIVGRAKSDFSGHEIIISPPTVIHGRDFKISPQRGAACVSIPCTCDYGEFQIDISMINNSASA